MPNTAPIGFLRVANDYLRAARTVQQPPVSELEALRQRISLPAYFLVGHASELALKAFLLGRGHTITELRSRKYGHDLAALIAESRKRKLGREVRLSARELDCLRLLNECYSAKEFEYAINGYRRLPSYALVFSTATKLCEGLQGYCRRIGA